MSPKGFVGGGLGSAGFVASGGTSRLLSQKMPGLPDFGLGVPEPGSPRRIGMGSGVRGGWGGDGGLGVPCKGFVGGGLRSVEGVRQGSRIQKTADLDTPSRFGELDTESTKEKSHKPLWLMAF